MTRIKLTFWGLCAGLTLLWLVADPVAFGSHPFAQTQISYVNYTGIVAMGTMAVSLLLALRSVAVEPYVGGLDKSYRLHKWLGVAALVMILGHWVLVQTPGWLRALGLAPRPARGTGRRPPTGPAFLHAVQGPARGLGQWCFYAAVILIVLALMKWFPYRRFIQTHRLLAIVYLFLVFHSAVLLKTGYWSQPVGWVIAGLMLVGGAAAIFILFRRVGRTRQAVGEVEALTPHREGSILGVSVCLKDRWPGHEPGQFAFVKFEDEEAPHPFTISNAWKDDGRLIFLIKGLGDYTRALPAKLKTGALATVEGPYGRFTFAGRQPRQIWVSAGIGIAPFVSRLQELAAHPDGNAIDLFHATAERNVEEVRRLRALAHAAHVSLHIWVASEKGRLNAQRIREAVPEWKSADVWFCGPVGFGKELRKELLDAGLPASAFHQELFHLR